jgi:hypothetical protein
MELYYDQTLYSIQCRTQGHIYSEIICVAIGDLGPVVQKKCNLALIYHGVKSFS